MFYDFEHQILIGTILGGSSLVKPINGKNYHLSMRSKNIRWLQYKMAEMPKFFSKSKIHSYNGTYRCNSCSHKDLNEIQKIVYCDRKKIISMELLDSLKDIALAIWFLDGGSKTGRNRKNAYINVTKFGKHSKIIHQYFNELGMNCNLHSEKNRIKIVFTVDGTFRLLQTISHCIPLFMIKCCI